MSDSFVSYERQYRFEKRIKKLKPKKNLSGDSSSDEENSLEVSQFEKSLFEKGLIMSPSSKILQINSPDPSFPKNDLSPNSPADVKAANRVAVGVSVKTAHGLLERFLDIEKPHIQPKMMDFFLLDGVVSMLVRFITCISPKNPVLLDPKNELSWQDTRRKEHSLKSLRVSPANLRRAYNAVHVLSSSNVLNKSIVKNNIPTILYELFEIFTQNSAGSFFHFSKLFDSILLEHPIETVKYVLYPPPKSFLDSKKYTSNSFGTFFSPSKPVIHYLIPFLSEAPIRNSFIKIFFSSWTGDRVSNIGMVVSDFIYFPPSVYDNSIISVGTKISRKDKDFIQNRFESLRDSGFWSTILDLIESNEKTYSDSISDFVSFIIEDYSNFLGVETIYEPFFNDDYLIRKLGQIVASSPEINHQSQAAIKILSSLFSKSSCMYNRVTRARNHSSDLSPDIFSSNLIVPIGIEARLELETFVPAFFSLLVGIHGESDLTSNAVHSRRLSDLNVSSFKTPDVSPGSFPDSSQNEDVLFTDSHTAEPSSKNIKTKSRFRNLDIPRSSTNTNFNSNSIDSISLLFPSSPSLSPSSTLSASPTGHDIRDIENGIQLIDLNLDSQPEPNIGSSNHPHVPKPIKFPMLTFPRLNLFSIIINILSEAEDLDEILGWVDLRVWDVLTHWLLLYKSNQIFQSLFYKLISLVVQQSIYTHQQLMDGPSISSIKRPDLESHLCSCSTPPIPSCVACFFRRNLSCNSDEILSYIVGSSKLVDRIIDSLKSSIYYSESCGFFILILNTFRLAIQSDRMFFRLFMISDKVINILLKPRKNYIKDQEFYLQIYILFFGTKPPSSSSLIKDRTPQIESEKTYVSPTNSQVLSNDENGGKAQPNLLSESICMIPEKKSVSRSKSKSKHPNNSLTVNPRFSRNKHSSISRSSLPKPKSHHIEKKSIISLNIDKGAKMTDFPNNEAECGSDILDPIQSASFLLDVSENESSVLKDSSSYSDHGQKPKLNLNVENRNEFQHLSNVGSNLTDNINDLCSENPLDEIIESESEIMYHSEIDECDDLINHNFDVSNKESKDNIDKPPTSGSSTPKESYQPIDVLYILEQLDLASAHSKLLSCSNRLRIHQYCLDLPPLPGTEGHLQKWQSLLLSSETWLLNLTFIRAKTIDLANKHEDFTLNGNNYQTVNQSKNKPKPLPQYTPLKVIYPEILIENITKPRKVVPKSQIRLPKSKASKALSPRFESVSGDEYFFLPSKAPRFKYNRDFSPEWSPKSRSRYNLESRLLKNTIEKKIFIKRDLSSGTQIYNIDSQYFSLPLTSYYNKSLLCKLLRPSFELETYDIDYGSVYAYSLGFGVELFSKNPVVDSSDSNSKSVGINAVGRKLSKCRRKSKVKSVLTATLASSFIIKPKPKESPESL
ncbi:hypothetical protein AYI68_g4840 [Smittium mucronatum]|uniref:Uncharacterized protein n=1 Tax=Smittium mucronatum TaxID=133383 RepID=A0A1R0GW35_9FUNG|nr:hypothetical protein AYI68_g4840 [Smittium mucronatum]